MNKTYLSIVIACGLLLGDVAWAANVYFNDGRVCKGCKVKYTTDGYIASVTKKGVEWFHPDNRVIVDKHPYARAYAQGLSQAGYQYSAQQQAQQSRRLNCSTNGNFYGQQYFSNTNCY